MTLSRCPVASFLSVGAIFFTPLFGAEVASPALDREFTQSVRPFINEYCVGCHSGKTPAAQLDLKSFTTISSVVQDFGHWNLLMERIERQEMPPKPLPQPPADRREKVIEWVKAVRADELRKTAGDPGPVLARRLSNSEYNYTIRDLTGADIRPTREFPVDPANQAGFDNTGETLNMSPALFNKYLAAAREVADHMALTPDGFIFAPGPVLSETDRDQFAIKRIVDFYTAQPTDYADYFEAAWRYKYRAALGKPSATLASTATANKVSPKYLPIVWGILGESVTSRHPRKAEVGPIAKLQDMWHSLPAPASGKADEAAVHAQCVEMRDFVVKIRNHTAMQFTAPVLAGPPAPPAAPVLTDGLAPAGGRGGGRGGYRPPRGLPAASQPLLTWKYTQFNTHRRDYDPDSLRLDTDPKQAPPEIPKYAGLHQEAAVRWAAVMKTAQLADPDLVIPAAKRAEYEESFARFAKVFPDAFYIKERGKFFPDDSVDSGRLLSAGYHSVTGYWRDDNPLQELILDDAGKRELDKLWTEFDFYASHTARTFVQYYFNQSGEVQGGGAESGRPRPTGKEVTDSSVIAGIRDQYIAFAKASDNPIAAAWMSTHFDGIDKTLRSLEKMRAQAEPAQLQALVRFAERAYRRPLSATERDGLVSYYHKLREKGDLSHEDAMRDSIASILISPEFFFRIDLQDPAFGAATSAAAHPAAAIGTPLPAYSLANRLSYFLWSSMPDQELLKHAAAGDLGRPDVLAAETRRMLKDPRSRGLAVEFAANWLDSRHFETYNSVDRERFPNFTNDLRNAMFEEPIRFFDDVIKNNRSILDMLYGNYTFVNPVLAKHYGMNDIPQFRMVEVKPAVAAGPGRAGAAPAKGDPPRPVLTFADPSVNANTWVRIDDAGKYDRGGLLPMAVFLTQSSPGLRTSPVKRGYWQVRRVLGEVIPPPPPVVPELPQDEAKTDAPLREVLAQHRANPLCAGCHARFDVFGLAMEGYGPVGEKRSKDLAGRPIDNSATFPGGFEGSGFRGVQAYIKENRQKDYIDNISRKLLSYSLGRTLLLSDEPLIEKMEARLDANDYRFDSLVETIVSSPQFLNKRNIQVTQNKRNTESASKKGE